MNADVAYHPALNLDEIVEHIFKFMPMKQLHCVSRVSKRWMNLAHRVKSGRHQIAYLLYENSGMGDLESQIGKHLEVLAAHPSVALLFCSSKLHEKPVAVSKGGRKRESLLLTSYFRRVLPPSCRILGLTACGVVGTSFNMSKIAELESSKAASCLLLPHLNGLDITSFELTEGLLSDNWPGGDQANSNSHRTHGGELKQLSAADVDAITRIPGNKPVQLILLFLTDPDSSLDTAFTKALVRRYGCKNTLVAGGYGYEVLTGETGTRHRDSSTTGLGIAFSGDRLQVTSVILDADVNDLEEVKKCLRQLVVPNLDVQAHRDRCVGFMFACVGRGKAFYNGADCVESKAFAQLYPGIPLLGFFGEGEIGFDFPRTPFATVRDGDDTKLRLFHSYCSIFVMLTFS